ncbi:MAG: Crp/Fnr family transcriptional regulator [Rhodospirillaceae bacterium]
MTDRTAPALLPADMARNKRSWRCSPVDCGGFSSLLKMAASTGLTEQAELFTAGQKGDMLPLVLSGCVGLLMSDDRGRKTLVKIVGPGQFVGQNLVLTDDSGCFSARALTAARVTGISKDEIRHALDTNSCFRRFFVGTMSEGLRESVTLFSRLKLMSAPQRLGAHLLSIVGCNHGPARLHISVERQALAEMLGMQPESLSRAFLKLAELGVSRWERNVITIDEVERLAAFCEAASALSPISGQAAEEGEPWKMPRRGFSSDALHTLMPDTALFSLLPEAETKALLAKARLVSYEHKTTLFQSGGRADHCFVVIGGQVRLFVTKADGRETTINLIQTGESFAEAALLGSGCYPVNAEVQPGTRLLHIPKEALLNRILATSTLTLPLLEKLARRQRQLFESIMEFKTCTPTERLVLELLKLTDVESGAATVSLKMPKAALASHLGVAPESLSRIFSRLKPLGIKTSPTSKVYISEVAALRGYSKQTVA